MLEKINLASLSVGEDRDLEDDPRKTAFEILRDYKLADWMYERLVKAINEFEEDLSDDLITAAKFVSLGNDAQITIDDMGYHNPDIIIFYGTTSDGSPAKLIQHTSQLNLMLVAVKRSNPDEPRRKIGFYQNPEANEEEK